MMKRALGWIAGVLALFCMGLPQVHADVGPPAGKKRIELQYNFKAPAPSKYTFMIVMTSRMRPARIEMSPVVWDKSVSLPRGYRTRAQLVALTPEQVTELVDLLGQTKKFAKQAKKLKAMDVKAKAAWLTKVSYEVASRGKLGDVRLFFKKKGVATSQILYTRATVDQSFPSNSVVRHFVVRGVVKDDVILKYVPPKKKAATKKKAGNKKGTSAKKKMAWVKERWPWGVGILAVLVVLSFAFRRK